MSICPLITIKTSVHDKRMNGSFYVPERSVTGFKGKINGGYLTECESLSPKKADKSVLSTRTWELRPLKVR